ncbi:MAG: cysteine hydrolase family protein [Ktedonobacteraceae bacterium]
MASMNTEAVIEAKPEPTTIDLARTAVVVVDMQNDFGAEGGMFHRAGVDISSIHQAIVPTARVLAAARTSGVKIVYLKTEYRPDLSDLGPVDSPNWIALKRSRVGERVTTPDGTEGHIMIRDTWNTQIVCELVPEPGDIVVSKHRFSGFYGTDLEMILRGLGIEYLVFTGCTTSVCVESTMRDAMFRDFRCVLLADCTAEPIGQGLSRSNHDASLFILQTVFGWVSDSAHFIEALDAQPVVNQSFLQEPEADVTLPGRDE